MSARTGEQFLDGLRGDARELWLNGVKITHPLDHDELRGAAMSLARVYDLQHEHAAEMLAPSPADGAPVNVTHLIPRSREDLERRRRAIELVAALSGGTMGRTPDYLNVTFACFAGRSDVWARRGNEQGAANIVAYQAQMRDRDLSTTHSIMNPQVDRSKPEAEQAAGQVALHKVGETESHITVRGARMLATLAPFADELTIYPGSDIRPQDGRYALSFAIPMGTPGLKFICRDSYSKQTSSFDHPLSSRFDEVDAVAIFDDVEVPKERVFLDGDTEGYSEVITDTGWRGHIMHQAFTRAYVKLSFAFGLGHMIANTTGVGRFDHIQEKLGQIWNMAELTRSALVAAEAGSALDEGGVWYPDDRPFLALRGEMPKWLPYCNELLQLIGGGGFMCTPSEADLHGPMADAIATYYQAAGADAERRIRLFRLAWDYIGSDLGGRGELYERFYLSDSWRMTALAYKIADKRFAESLVEQFLRDWGHVTQQSGYSLPLSPRGTASLVPAPPWHYVGDFLVIEYWADPAAVAAVLPEGLEPHPDPGRCAALFVDWQSCADDGHELLEPGRGQYKEFFIVVNALLDGEPVTTCPYIWVDKDFALVRGWIQGFPKKLGQIEMTRSFGLDCRAEGRTFAGTVSANGHRLAVGTVTPERKSQTGPTHNDPPLINRRHFPRLAAGRHGDPAVHELVRAQSRDRSISAIYEGPAAFELFAAPGEEHAELAPVRVGTGFRFTFAYTVDDLETVREL